MNLSTLPAARLAAPVIALAASSMTCHASLNLVTNGGFEAGNTGFTSDYVYQAAPVDPWLWAGEYSVAGDAHDTHPGFYGYAHSGNNFFVANGAEDTTQSVWMSQAISVTNAGQNYRFQAWICSVVPSNYAPPSLSFEISNNGQNWTALGSTPSLEGANEGEWFGASADVTLANAGTYFIRLRNNSNAYEGNDFGLDDIYFGLASGAPPVPAPGCVALLGLTGLVGGRRRKA